MWADRILKSEMAAHGAVARGAATRRRTWQRISGGWRRWAAHPDGWLSILHAELICRV